MNSKKSQILVDVQTFFMYDPECILKRNSINYKAM